MTDESKRWEAAVMLNYGGDSQAQQAPSNVSNESTRGNYTLLRDSYGNIVKVYGLNLEHQNYELFNSSPNPNLPFLSNVPPPHPQPPASYNFQQEPYEESRMHYHYGGSANAYHDSDVQSAESSYSSNPIINQLVGNWAPGTSIYGNCFINNNGNARDHLPYANETQFQTYEQMHNAANNQSTLNNNVESAISSSVPPQLKKKQRIVAEVKPMRMSYSDVLSKNVLTEAESNSSNITLMNNSTSANVPNSQGNSKKKNNQSRSSIQLEKRSPITVTHDEKLRKAQNITINTEKQSKPTNDQKSCITTVKDTKEIKRTNNSTLSENKSKRASKKSEYNIKNKSKDTQTSFKAASEYEDDNYHLVADNLYEDRENENVYTVNYERATKGIFQSSSHKKNKNAANLTSRAATKQDKFFSKRNQKNHKSQKYCREMLQKLWIMSVEYITKFVLWLWSLVSDVIYLSFGIIYDKLVVGYNHVQRAVGAMCIGNRPSLWIKSLWSKVHLYLQKISFWQKMFARNQNEPVKDYYKDGKLPTTADEAMYSLLNCKGKDAYSILGVPPDCQQEQIRKHFHKIALLVHPDKNKQIGSEEAFKVLQRSFELIGEPENRKQYDLSLAEALNAEKAWSELNDLLKQLHTKISEAANTIRCSSCNNRHPRKPTGRPHYAARECNSCRIRHSAREGDIWAETAFFGFRWKYLALMEGKVFDITEWANCSGQKGALSHLQPNSHIVQYRIVLGNSQQQQQMNNEKEKYNKKEQTSSESAFDDILANIYSGQKKGATRRKHKK